MTEFCKIRGKSFYSLPKVLCQIFLLKTQKQDDCYNHPASEMFLEFFLYRLRRPQGFATTCGAYRIAYRLNASILFSQKRFCFLLYLTVNLNALLSLDI